MRGFFLMSKNNLPLDLITLNNFDRCDFLQNYWQQKPLLIRNALPDFENPISPDELAGLACEAQIESRLVTAQQQSSQQSWQLQHGPFTEQHFQQLPDKDWTLLVQAVDHYAPEVAGLLHYFRFIPNWRIDDIMVSYATIGGSVGPHYDNYDVFLIQGLGTRHWQVGTTYSSTSARQNNDHLRLLDGFKAEQEWVLEPGDILYLPPLYGHWGIANSDDCMTYSVGFKAPSHAEILSDYCDERISCLKEELRYNDANLKNQSNPGEIAAEAIAKVQSILQQQVCDNQQIAKWFGRYMTQPKYQDTAIQSGDNISPAEFLCLIEKHGVIFKDQASRFAFLRDEERVLLFINGEDYPCHNRNAALAQLLASSDHHTIEQLTEYLNEPECVKLLTTLLTQGSLYFDDEL